MNFRLFDIVKLFPIRGKRLLRHFIHFRYHNFSFWTLELLFQLLELLGIGDFYDISSNIIKFSSRRLSEREIALAKSIFGESLPYERVRIDESAWLGPRQGKFCYVSFYTINSWGKMLDSLLIHELTHIWQYHYVGIIYIPRALAAQRSAEGYNYGGVTALREAIKNNKKLLDFNYEQQADIIEDYFRLLIGLRPSWGSATHNDLIIYAHFAKQLDIKH
ncbi:MAG: hypothetical protein SFU99_08415 [Saprospiraceae bacterium]|nr:hypothetical protein [Saprospiraceae bacterium]